MLTDDIVGTRYAVKITNVVGIAKPLYASERGIENCRYCDSIDIFLFTSKKNAMKSMDKNLYIDEFKNAKFELIEITGKVL